MKKIAFQFVFLLCSLAAFAQMPQQGGAPKGSPTKGGPAMNIGRLYGKIVETSGKPPIAYASVTVFRNVGGRDSLIGGALTAENGDFNITGLPMGPLTVKVSFVGYKDFKKVVKVMPPDNVEQDLGDIKLAEDAVISNPSAKYETSTTGGILNLVLKKNRKPGYNGMG